MDAITLLDEFYAAMRKALVAHDVRTLSDEQVDAVIKFARLQKLWTLSNDTTLENMSKGSSRGAAFASMTEGNPQILRIIEEQTRGTATRKGTDNGDSRTDIQSDTTGNSASRGIDANSIRSTRGR